MPWSDEYLDTLKNRRFPPVCFLKRLVLKRDRVRPLLDQFARLWESLPEKMRNDKNLITSLRSPIDDTLWGAYNEVFAYWLLKRYFPTVEYKPQVGNLTPDFSATSNDVTYFIEVFSLSAAEQHKSENREMALFLEEISHIKSKYRIILAHPPVSNSNGHFHGLGRAMELFFRDFADPKKGHHYFVEANGSSVKFNIVDMGKEGGLYAGGIGGVHWGDPHVKTLSNNLEKKRRKYKFPFIALCMVNSGWADLYTLVDALIGEQYISVPVSEKAGFEIQKGSAGFSETGIWGSKNKSLSSNKRIMGLLYCRLSAREDERIQIYAHMLMNQHIESSLAKIFHDIPDVFLSECEGDRMEMPAIKLLPE